MWPAETRWPERHLKFSIRNGRAMAAIERFMRTRRPAGGARSPARRDVWVRVQRLRARRRPCAPISDPARGSPRWREARESGSVVSAAAGATAIGRAAPTTRPSCEAFRCGGDAAWRAAASLWSLASGLWNRRRTAQAAVTPAGLAAAAAPPLRCAATDGAGDADRSGGSRACGYAAPRAVRKTRGRSIARVTLAARAG